jgi:hypothetical protein
MRIDLFYHSIISLFQIFLYSIKEIIMKTSDYACDLGKNQKEFKKINIGQYKASINLPDNSEDKNFFVFIGADFAKRFTQSYNIRAPVLTMQLASLSTWQMGEVEIAEALLSSVPQLSEARQIIMVGSSGGGFAAFRIAAALARLAAPKPVRMLAFSPPSKIWPPEPRRMQNSIYRRMISGAEKNEKTKFYLETHGDLVPLLLDLPRTAANVDFRSIIVVGRNHSLDWKQASRLQHIPNVTILPISTDYHLVEYFMLLRMEGQEGTLQGFSDQWKLFGSGTKNLYVPDDQMKKLYKAAKMLRDKYPTLLDLITALDPDILEEPATLPS